MDRCKHRNVLAGALLRECDDISKKSLEFQERFLQLLFSHRICLASGLYGETVDGLVKFQIERILPQNDRLALHYNDEQSSVPEC